MHSDLPSRSVSAKTERRSQKPLYITRERGVSWSVYEVDASNGLNEALLHNLSEWQAKSIAAILNDNG